MSGLLTATMIDDFQHDPVLAVKVLGLQDELPPHQKIRLRLAWHYKYVMDCSGNGTGKTENLAMIILLRMLLFSNRDQGIVSKTMRQGQEVYAKIENWCRLLPIVTSQIAVGPSGKLSISHGGEVHQIRARNGSRIRLVPPGFNTNGEGMNSESWVDGNFDEWTTWNRMDVLTGVIVKRVRKPIDRCYNEDDPIFGRHFLFFGTAGYRWQPEYELARHFQQRMEAGDRNYVYMSFSRHDVPDRYKRLRPDDAFELTRGMAKRQDEVNTKELGKWSDDSMGFYAAFWINKMRNPNVRVVLGADEP